MKKTPTIFERDWDGDKSRVLPVPHPGCEWVFDGEGVATRKLDGTCCMVRDGKLFRRREIRPGQLLPDGWEPCDQDELTRKLVGWVPVSDGNDDKYHREVFEEGKPLDDGTYELIGPKIQGNPEGVATHILIRHGHGLAGPITAPRDYDGLARFFTTAGMEGVVFHHPDGRTAKIKARDFGVSRK